MDKTHAFQSAWQENGRLLISVVRRGRGDYVVRLVKQAGARGSTILFGRGTASSGFLTFFCLGDTEKELVFTLAPDAVMRHIITALRQDANLCRKAPGIGFVIKVPDFIRHGYGNPVHPETETPKKAPEEDMTEQRKLICVIVNAGMADDVMHAAREAGASGGTILRARGTATGDDASFFGITIVPEKEMLMILAENEASEKILPAIASTPCLNEPGCGIAYCVPVTDFFPLGKKSNS